MWKSTWLSTKFVACKLTVERGIVAEFGRRAYFKGGDAGCLGRSLVNVRPQGVVNSRSVAICREHPMEAIAPRLPLVTVKDDLGIEGQQVLPTLHAAVTE